jgi:hypothetical protein
MAWSRRLSYDTAVWLCNLRFRPILVHPARTAETVEYQFSYQAPPDFTFPSTQKHDVSEVCITVRSRKTAGFRSATSMRDYMES